MVAPSLMSHRRFPLALRGRVQVAYAEAWERLTDTHVEQAAHFARRLQGRLGAEDALLRYFREVAVPSLMQETVRARALIRLARAGGPPSDEESGTLELLGLLRPDHLVEAIRRRAQLVEETNLACRLAASLADEAICLTHVRNATAVADLLADEISRDEAIMHYIRCFDLPTVQAHMVFQRSLAEVAERHPLLSESPLACILPEPLRAARPSRPVAAAFELQAVGR
ncbi:MAG TPA: hypothetical protein VFL95_09585 [Gemmatimonadales bacterium]|nr:hypothetical protein [Gemmatimonadales bacterium]